MRLRVIVGVAVLALVGSWSWAGNGASRGGRTAAATMPATPLLVNGKPFEGTAVVVDNTPFLALQAATTAVSLKRPGVVVLKTAADETSLSRPEAIVRIKAGAKQMYVDGQATPLKTPAMEQQGVLYLPVEVLQALYPDYQLGLAYNAQAKTVQFGYRLKLSPITQKMPMSSPLPGTTRPGPAAAPQSAPAAAAACAPTGQGRGVGTQEFGKAGAKMEIVACLPITHGCHVRTEAELKKAYEKHPSDVHLLIYDLFGQEGQQYVAQHGGQRAVVFINGKTEFDLNGRKVRFEMVEDRFYTPADIVPVVDQELRAK